MIRETCGIVLATRGELPRCERIQVLDPGANEVLVRMVASGVCHTDISSMRDARVSPLLLGHEGAGIVEQVGSEVRHVQPGDHVVINWLAKCGRCRRCASGRQDLCEHIQSTQAPRVLWQGNPLNVLLQAGTFCSHVVVPAMGAVPIRRDLRFEHAALLGCAVATGVGAVLYTAKVQPGEGVVVIGAGGVGINVVQGARLAHAYPIIAIDVEDNHLELARTCGATHLVNGHASDAIEQVKDLTGGRGVEHVFEVVGAPNLMQQGIEMLCRGGMLTLIGAAARDTSFSFQPRRFMSQQQSIQGCIYGSIRPLLDLPMFADWATNGELYLDQLPVRYIGLEDVPAMFEQQPSGHEVRTVVRFGEDS